MTSVVAEIHISPTSSAPLPTSPLPLEGGTQLTPSTQLRVPLEASDQHSLNTLADSLDSTRAHLNSILTTWKLWTGKEADAQNSHTTSNKDDDDNDNLDDQDDDNDEEE